MSVEITAEMAGVVYEVLVAVGETVQAGQQVLILEAMKMEVPVVATAAGVVGAIAVANGDAVDPGDLLVTMD